MHSCAIPCSRFSCGAGTHARACPLNLAPSPRTCSVLYASCGHCIGLNLVPCTFSLLAHSISRAPMARALLILLSFLFQMRHASARSDLLLFRIHRHFFLFLRSLGSILFSPPRGVLTRRTRIMTLSRFWAQSPLLLYASSTNLGLGI
jgi:hypothetical protein